ncbi:MAG: undecaprenyldiphospho-muramoylpentapeptide beta-N-acetylglucosaminyltransferase [Anaerolineales bacterium]
MRIWMVGGGTGGHVYPALAVMQALQDAEPAIDPATDLMWVGATDGMEADLVERAGVSFLGIPAGGVHGVALLNAVRNGWELMRGTVMAWRHMRRARPDVLLTTGGYVSGPVALAAQAHGVPILLFVPDIEPAQSVRFVARMAERIGVTVADSRAYLPEEKVVVTGYPLREEITRWTRDAAREALSLSPEGPVVLVFGGSRGARSINRALAAHLPELLAQAEIIHISGKLDWPEVEAARETLSTAERAKYHAYAYLHERMGAALAAADVAVCRAGASVLGELPYFGLPAVLVPYPYAWRYQRVNAGWLADRGAALVVEDADLREELVSTVAALLNDDARRAEMAASARALARPDAAANLASELLALGRDS